MTSFFSFPIYLPAFLPSQMKHIVSLCLSLLLQVSYWEPWIWTGNPRKRRATLRTILNEPLNINTTALQTNL